MLDARSRVTVIGAHRQVDVALPSSAPIGEYVAGLADLCGLERRGALPSAWSLAFAGAAPLPLGVSLAEAGVPDGQVLYLRDLADDLDAGPIVDDIEDAVAGAADAQRQSRLPGGLVVIGFGLAWLAATAVLVVLHHPGSPTGTSACLTLAGLLLLATGWALRQRPTRVPAALCLLVSLVAVPCLAASGALIAQVLAGPSYLWIGGIVGANTATLMVLGATPDVVVLVIEAQLVLAAILAPVLILVGANRVQVAAATVLAGLAMLAMAKPAAASVVAWTQAMPREDASMAHATTRLLIRAQHLFAVVIAGPAVTLVVAFIVLARYGGGYAAALTCVAGLALLVRGGQAGFTSERAVVGGVGLVGVFGVLASLVDRVWTGGPLAIILITVVGLGLVGAGAVGTAFHDARQPRSEPAPIVMGPGAPPMARPERRRLVDMLGVVANIACVPLALGVFGVFGDLTSMGRSIVGG